MQIRKFYDSRVPGSLGDRAFTLIELFVTIAIIALLAALLTPSLSKAIKRSQMVKCSNNLRQIYVAMTLYGQDNDGKIVNCTGVNTNWILDITPYLEREGTVVNNARHRGILACPASKNTASSSEGSDYAKNYYTGGQSPQQYNDQQHHTDLKFINVQNLSAVILAADSNWRDIDYQDQSSGSDGTIYRSRIVFRHGQKGIKGEANVLFLDGHIESVKPTDPMMNVTPTPWYKLPLNPTATS